MKRLRIPGIIDLLISDDRSEIESLTRDPKLDRSYSNRPVLANRCILHQVLGALQIGGKRFPTVSPRSAPGRAEAQEALGKYLNRIAPAYSSGPNDLNDLASFVRGEVAADRLGPLVQQVVGRLFVPEFQSTQETWNAALVLAEAPRSMNPFMIAWWAITGKVDKAKLLLASMVGGDLAAVHAIGVALHNIVSGVNLMRQLYSDPSSRTTLSPEVVSSRCLFAPATVLRQPTSPDSSAAGQVEGGTLVMLKLQDANAKTPDADLVFLRTTWSRCPAEQWVPSLLAGIWRRARQTDLQSAAGVLAK